jgi:hypothetical protein
MSQFFSGLQESCEICHVDIAYSFWETFQSFTSRNSASIMNCNFTSL